MLGGLSFALIVLLVVSGLYLEQFYQPTQTGARESVIYIISRAPLGDWVRSVHSWSAEALAALLTAHLVVVFWRRSYRAPRELTWWAGVALAGLVFLLFVTGTVLRADQEGFEALAHFSAAGKLLALTGGTFFTDGFTPSTSMLARDFSFHTSMLPILTAGVIGLHFWLIRQLGIDARGGGSVPFRVHAVRLCAIALLLYAGLGAVALLAPEGLGYASVAGMEVTKPAWPLLWVYGLEDLLGMWGMVIGPAVVGSYLVALPVLDRSIDDRPGVRSGAGWLGVAMGVAILSFGLFGLFGAARPHLGM
jgi:quinol-cytochrome oxidoreductase complex cytochrome b subunit